MVYALVATLAATVSGCGGGGGGGGPASVVGGGVSSGTGYVAGVYMPSTQFKGQCAAPRPGNTNDHPGSVLSEQLWLRSWSNELYLWYNEIPDTNPAGNTVAQYFDLLKTPALTATGTKKDKFHFTWLTSDWLAFSQSGVQAGYGIEWVVGANSPPRQASVAYIEPNSPAAAANIQRGAQLLAVDGTDFVNGSATPLNAGLFPAGAGETHSFTIRDLGATVSRTVQMTSANVVSTPVQNVKSISTTNGTVGYMLFNDHIATSEAQLINAISTLQQANVSALVLDIRYNGGGYLDIASELAYMIAGPTMTSGRTFERIKFNSKYTTTDPVTGQALSPTPFFNRSQGFSGTSGVSLPTLNLATVYVLTGPGTCSASESIINGLRGVNVQVVQIGSTTCGKPYGFYPQDNCGTTYFTIEFQGVNDANFGDYSDGFAPANTATIKGVALPGCSVADDLNHALGDPLEGRLAAALNYRNSGSCPIPSGSVTNHATIQSVQDTSLGSGEIMSKSSLRENRWYR
jgi:hypothetical protein